MEDDAFQHLAALAMRASALQLNSDDESKALEEVKHDSIQKKQIYAALVNLALEAARHDANEQEISSLIEERLPKERLQTFVELFKAARGEIRSQLARTTSSKFPTIVEVDWRLDFYVQNNQVEHIRTPSYIVSLTTQNPDGSLKKIEFSATLDEIQDLAAKVKDAANAVKLVKV